MPMPSGLTIKQQQVYEVQRALIGQRKVYISLFDAAVDDSVDDPIGTWMWASHLLASRGYDSFSVVQIAILAVIDARGYAGSDEDKQFA